MANRSDNFTRADNATSLGSPSDGGAGWSVFAASTWGVVSNQAYTSAATVNDHAYLEASAADVDVQVTMPVVSAGGPILRWVSANQYIVVSAVPGTLTLYRFNSGYTSLGSYSGTVADGAVVKITGSGSSLKVFLNGSQVVPSSGSITDAQGQTATKHGVQNYNDTVTRFAAFSVADPAAGGGTVSGSGSPSLAPASASGAGSVTAPGSGSPSLPPVASSGSGSVSGPTYYAVSAGGLQYVVQT